MVKATKTSTQRALSERVPTDRQQTADYIASVSLGLSGIAEQADFPFLKYLLDMTAEEAMQQSDMPRRRRVNSPAE